MTSQLFSKLSFQRKLFLTFARKVNPSAANNGAFVSTQPHVDINESIAKDVLSSWKLCGAVCLIRLPILDGEMSEMERNYLALREQLEYEHSVFNKWELEGQRQQAIIKDIESGSRNPEDIDFKETTQDLEDSYEAALKSFKESNLEIAPEDKDMKNINRRPRDALIFATKQQLGNDQIWMLPCVEWNKPESMKESAVRAMESHIGNDVDAHFTSNAPSGFYKYKFPKTARDDKHVGAKLFIYNAFLPRISQTKATYSFDPEKFSDNILDYAWLARDEMRSLMKPKYSAVIDRIVLKW